MAREIRVKGVYEDGITPGIQQSQGAVTSASTKMSGSTGSLKDAFDKLKGGAQGAVGGIKGMITAAGPVGIAIGVITGALIAAIAQINKFAKLGDEIDKASQRASMSIMNYQQWSRTLELSGARASDLEVLMKGLNRAIAESDKEGSKSAEAFKKLGISARDSNGHLKKSEDLFKESVKALSKMEDGSERAALAVAVLGKKAQDLNPLLNEGAEAIERAHKESERFALMSEKQVKSSAAFTDAMGDMGKLIQKVLINALMPVMDSITLAVQDMIDSGFIDFLGDVAKVIGLLIRVGMIPLNLAINVLSQAWASLELVATKAVRNLMRAIDWALDKIPARFIPEGWRRGVDDFGDALDGRIEESQRRLASLRDNMGKILTLGSPSGPTGDGDSKGTGAGGDEDKEETGLIGVRSRSLDYFVRIFKDHFVERMKIRIGYHELERENISDEFERRRAIAESAMREEFAELDGHLKRKLISTQEYDEYLRILAVKHSREYQQIRLDEIAQEEAIEKSRVDMVRGLYEDIRTRTLTAYQIQYEDRMTHLEQMRELFAEDADVMAVIRDEELEAQKAFQQAQYQAEVDHLNSMTEIGAQFASNFLSIFQEMNQAQMQSTKRKYDHERNLIQQSNKSNKEKQKLTEELNKKEAEEMKKLADQQKALALMNAIINTAQSISNALTMMPPPVGIAMAAVMAALGGVQIGIIASQSFKDGGIVEGSSMSGDKVDAKLNSGEMVLTRNQQNTLFRAIEGGGIGGSVSIGGPTIIVEGNLDQAAADRIIKSEEDRLESLRADMEMLVYHGRLPEAVLN